MPPGAELWMPSRGGALPREKGEELTRVGRGSKEFLGKTGEKGLSSEENFGAGVLLVLRKMSSEEIVLLACLCAEPVRHPAITSSLLMAAPHPSFHLLPTISSSNFSK